MSNLPNKTLRLYNFRDYYNRIIDRLETVEEYDAKGHHLHTLTAANFNPNDDVSTQHIFNFEPEDGIFPDYMLLCSEDDDIISRWWIIDTTRTRNGQYNMILLRDVVADYYQETLNATTFIEKAKLNVNNRLIFNDENMGFNQKRQAPILLQDETKMPWVVAYIPKNVPNDGGEVTPGSGQLAPSESKDVEASIYESNNPNEKIVKISNFTESDMYKNQYKNIIPSTFYYYDEDEPYKNIILEHTFNFFDSKFWDWNSTAYTMQFYPIYHQSALDEYKHLYQKLTVNESKYPNSKNTIGYNGSTGYSFESEMGTLYEYLTHVIPHSIGTDNGYQTILKTIEDYTDENGEKPFVSSDVFYDSYLFNDGDIIQDSTTGIKYVCNYYDANVKLEIKVKHNDPNTATLYNTLGRCVEILNSSDILNVSSDYPYLTDDSFKLIINGTFKKIRFSEHINKSIHATIRGYDARPSCQDALYDIVCTPYSDNYELYKWSSSTNQYYIYSPSAQPVQINKEAGLRILNQFVAQYGSGQAMDIQIVPFCPIKDITTKQEYVSGKIGINLDSPNVKAYDLILDKAQSEYDDEIYTRGVLFWAEYSNISGTIKLEKPIKMPTDPIDLKVKSQTEKYRITSPFFEASYEFNPYKNGGVSEFIYNASFKPYQPYFKVTPLFNSDYLYGEFSNYDARGCISTTNYSATQISDNWANFVQNNNTYKESFDRQIQSMELNNAIQDTKDLYSATLGTITGAASGASTGAMAGGGWGALAGGVVGGIASGVMGSINLDLNRMLRNEAIDYTKDQFGYQLGNIKAMPQTISKLSGITENNPLHFMLEKFICTEEEKRAFENKIKYNGMTTMVIDQIGNYIWDDEKTYIKGKLIRADGFHECYHVLNQLASELNKGVYI